MSVRVEGLDEPPNAANPNHIDNGTPANHGWPCFANQEIFEFFRSLRP